MTAGVRGATFQEFSWLHGDLRHDHTAAFAARMKDLGFGVHKCLQLVEASDLDRAHGDGDDDGNSNSYVPLLNEYDTGVLLRLALTTAQVIGEQADRFLVQAQERCDKAQPVTNLTTGGDHHHG